MLQYKQQPFEEQRITEHGQRQLNTNKKVEDELKKKPSQRLLSHNF